MSLSAPDDQASIATHVQDCLDSFHDACNSLIKANPDIRSKVLPGTIQESLGRFRLWVGNIGAHRRGRSSLDYKLREASHIRDRVLELLRNMKSVLQEALEIINEQRVPWEDLSDSDSDISDHKSQQSDGEPTTELAQLASNMAEINMCLMRLSMSIRNPAPHDQFKESAQIDVIHFEVFDVEHVRGKFPAAKDYLILRLGKAISRRRQYLRYREEHRKKLEQGLKPQPNLPEFAVPQLPATTNIAPSEKIDSTVASSIPQEFKASSVSPNLDEDDYYEDTLSQTSYASSNNDPARLRPPPLHAQGQDGEPFECPLCFRITSVRQTTAWNKHVYRDLQPYVCTFDECKIPDRTYESRHEWFQHELQAHRKWWECIEGCNQTFNSQHDFHQHLASEHEEIADDERIVDLMRNCERQEPMDSPADCYLCHLRLPSLIQLRRHLGKHHEELALFALPSHVMKDDDEDQEGDGEDKDSLSSVAGSGTPLASTRVACDECGMIFNQGDDRDVMALDDHMWNVHHRPQDPILRATQLDIVNRLPQSEQGIIEAMDEQIFDRTLILSDLRRHVPHDVATWGQFKRWFAEQPVDFAQRYGHGDFRLLQTRQFNKMVVTQRSEEFFGQLARYHAEEYGRDIEKLEFLIENKTIALRQILNAFAMWDRTEYIDEIHTWLDLGYELGFGRVLTPDGADAVRKICEKYILPANLDFGYRPIEPSSLPKSKDASDSKPVEQKEILRFNIWLRYGLGTFQNQSLAPNLLFLDIGTTGLTIGAEGSVLCSWDAMSTRIKDSALEDDGSITLYGMKNAVTGELVDVRFAAWEVDQTQEIWTRVKSYVDSRRVEKDAQVQEDRQSANDDAPKDNTMTSQLQSNQDCTLKTISPKNTLLDDQKADKDSELPERQPDLLAGPQDAPQIPTLPQQYFLDKYPPPIDDSQRQEQQDWMVSVTDLDTGIGRNTHLYVYPTHVMLATLGRPVTWYTYHKNISHMSVAEEITIHAIVGIENGYDPHLKPYIVGKRFSISPLGSNVRAEEIGRVLSRYKRRCDPTYAPHSNDDELLLAPLRDSTSNVPQDKEPHGGEHLPDSPIERVAKSAKEPVTSEYSIFVGDLGPEVTEFVLIQLFQDRYQSTKSATIMLDPISGVSRGCGFVRFANVEDQQRALIEMQGIYCGHHPIRVSTVTPNDESGGIGGSGGMGMLQDPPDVHSDGLEAPASDSTVTVQSPELEDKKVAVKRVRSPKDSNTIEYQNVAVIAGFPGRNGFSHNFVANLTLETSRLRCKNGRSLYSNMYYKDMEGIRQNASTMHISGEIELHRRDVGNISDEKKHAEVAFKLNSVTEADEVIRTIQERFRETTGRQIYFFDDTKTAGADEHQSVTSEVQHESHSDRVEEDEDAVPRVAGLVRGRDSALIEDSTDLNFCDVVQMKDGSTGCIVRVDGEDVHIVDQDDNHRSVHRNQLLRDLVGAIHSETLDVHGSKIRQRDYIEESNGRARKGQVLSVHRGVLYVHESPYLGAHPIFAVRSSNAILMRSAQLEVGARLKIPQVQHDSMTHTTLAASKEQRQQHLSADLQQPTPLGPNTNHTRKSDDTDGSTLQRTTTLRTELIKELSSTGDPRSLRLPQHFMHELDKRITKVLLGTEQIPEFHDPVVKRSFAVFLNQFKDPRINKVMSKERRAEDLLLMFFSCAAKELQKGNAPMDDSWKLTVDRHVGLFIRLISSILHTNDGYKDRQELLQRLNAIEKRLLAPEPAGDQLNRRAGQIDASKVLDRIFETHLESRDTHKQLNDEITTAASPYLKLLTPQILDRSSRLSKLVEPATDGIRVKVYELRHNGWFDRGTSICRGMTASDSDDAGLIATSEEEQTKKTLEIIISRDKGFQKQQDTLIVWTDDDGFDLALSFQDSEDCDRIWNFINETQVALNEHSGSDEGYGDEVPDDPKETNDTASRTREKKSETRHAETRNEVLVDAKTHDDVASPTGTSTQAPSNFSEDYSDDHVFDPLVIQKQTARGILEDWEDRYNSPQVTQADFFAPKELFQNDSLRKVRPIDPNEGATDFTVFEDYDESDTTHVAAGLSSGSPQFAPETVKAVDEGNTSTTSQPALPSLVVGSTSGKPSALKPLGEIPGPDLKAKHVLSDNTLLQIIERIIGPIVKEEDMKDFHPLIQDVLRRMKERDIYNLRDLEKTVIFGAPEFSTTATSYLRFCERFIQLLHATVDNLPELDQRLPTDRPYSTNYFLDLIEQIRRYAATMAATAREKDSKDPERVETDSYDIAAPVKGKRITACVLCRKRKLRCDGARPSCGTCKRLSHDCAYDEVRRKSGPKRGYVKELEDRLEKVNRLLKDQDTAESHDLVEDNNSSSPKQAVVDAVNSSKPHLTRCDPGDGPSDEERRMRRQPEPIESKHDDDKGAAWDVWKMSDMRVRPGPSAGSNMGPASNKVFTPATPFDHNDEAQSLWAWDSAKRMYYFDSKDGRSRTWVDGRRENLGPPKPPHPAHVEWDEGRQELYWRDEETQAWVYESGAKIPFSRSDG